MNDTIVILRTGLVVEPLSLGWTVADPECTFVFHGGIDDGGDLLTLEADDEAY